MGRQKPNDAPRRALLQRAQRRLSIGGRIARRGGPAEQGVGVEVAQEHGDEGVADGGVGVHVEGAADERGQGDEVLFGGVLGGGEEVPFEGEGVGEEGFGEGDGDDCFCYWVAEGTGVEVDLVGACKNKTSQLVKFVLSLSFLFLLWNRLQRTINLLDVDILPEALPQWHVLAAGTSFRRSLLVLADLLGCAQ